MRFLTLPSLYSALTEFGMTRSCGGSGSGAGRNYDSLSKLNMFRPAPLPFDIQSLVIPNHVAKAPGGSGEESHNRQEANQPGSNF
jgi:hypothetical protein